MSITDEYAIAAVVVLVFVALGVVCSSAMLAAFLLKRLAAPTITVNGDGNHVTTNGSGQQQIDRRDRLPDLTLEMLEGAVIYFALARDSLGTARMVNDAARAGRYNGDMHSALDMALGAAQMQHDMARFIVARWRSGDYKQGTPVGELIRQFQEAGMAGLDQET